MNISTTKQTARKGLLYGALAVTAIAAGVVAPVAQALDVTHADATSNSSIHMGDSNGSGMTVSHNDQTDSNTIKMGGNHNSGSDDDDDHPASAPRVVVDKPAAPAICSDLKLTLKDKHSVLALVSIGGSAASTAKIVSASYDFNDAKSNASVVVNAQTSASHVYVSAGTHTVKAVINLNVGGQTVTSVCQKPITITQPAPAPAAPAVVTPPAVTPPAVKPVAAPAAAPAPAPEALPNTGAGGIVGLFAAVTGGSTLAYRFVLSRRFGLN